MRPDFNLSPEARAFLAATPERRLERAAENLPHIRALSKKHAVAEAPRIVEATGVTLRDRVIGGVPCLHVSPATQLVEWSILYGFGGGFVEGSPLEDLTIIASLCERTGAQVIAPDYRLAPEHPWPAGLDDAFAVYRALAHEPFAIVGESAGGNLALCLMLQAQAHGIGLPKAAALLSPWCDLTHSGDSLTFNDGRDPTLNRRASRDAASHYIGRNAADDPLISPIYAPFAADFPPCIITTGTRDLLLSQAARLSERLRESGVRVDLRVWDGLWHVFEWYDPLPEAQQSLAQIAAFLSKEMNC